MLRYASVIDVNARKTSAALEEYVCAIDRALCSRIPRYPIDHPFATSLGGSDNIIAFHTERYGVRPLLVQGADAGAAVTAMGVLSDVLTLPWTLQATNTFQLSRRKANDITSQLLGNK